MFRETYSAFNVKRDLTHKHRRRPSVVPQHIAYIPIRIYIHACIMRDDVFKIMLSNLSLVREERKHAMIFGNSLTSALVKHCISIVMLL